MARSGSSARQSQASVSFESNAVKSICRAVADAKTVKLAVAFWGGGAIERLGLNRRRRRTQIICNLQSGACNPATIEALRKKRQFKIKTLDTLHAKVFWSPEFMIVGSANASANGLGLENDETYGWCEASIVTADRKAIVDARKWFDNLWKKSKSVTAKDIRIARDAWRNRRSQRPGARRTSKRSNGTKSLFTLVENAPTSLVDRELFITAAVERISPAGKEKFNEMRSERGWMKNDWWPYEDDTLEGYPWGRPLINCDVIGGKISVTGFHMVPPKSFVGRFKDDGATMYVVPMRNMKKTEPVVGDIAIRLSSKDKKELVRRLRLVRRRHRRLYNKMTRVAIPLDEFLAASG